MTEKTAKYVSILGHPLLTISLFSTLALFTFYSIEKASLISGLIIGGSILPIAIRMYRGNKKGTYTNFDVSNKVQRQSWYKYVLALLFIVTLTLFLTGQSPNLKFSVLLFFLLLLTSQIVNNFIKSSLHVSLNILIAFLIIQMNFTVGILFFLFIPIIAWARLSSKMHTLKEIMVGASIGLFWGFVSLLLLAE
jgi:hypothetical protein